MRTTHAPNLRRLEPTLPRVSAERALPCAGECGLVSQLTPVEAARATSWTCSSCHERAGKDVAFKARLDAALARFAGLLEKLADA